MPSTAARLFDRALTGGAAAAAAGPWGLQVGARADAVVADPACAATAGVPESRHLDALIFSSPARPWQQVMVAGRWAWGPAQAAQAAAVADHYRQVMSALWAEAGAQEAPASPAKPSAC